MPKESERMIVRSFSAASEEIRMLDAVARYHGLSKSAAIRALVRKEFWRIFPAGTEEIRPQAGARILGGDDDDE